MLAPLLVPTLFFQKPEKYQLYDANEGGYNNSEIQLAWYGKKLNRRQLEKISTDEGLDPVSAFSWANFNREQEDLSLFNESIINTTHQKYIESKSRWHTAIETLQNNKILKGIVVENQ